MSNNGYYQKSYQKSHDGRMLASGSTWTSDPLYLLYPERSSDYEYDRLQYPSPESKEYAQEQRGIQDELHRNGPYYSPPSEEQHRSAHEGGYQSSHQNRDGGPATTDQSSSKSRQQQGHASPNTENPSAQAQTDSPVRRASFRWYCASCRQGPYTSLMPKCIEPSCQSPLNDDCPREQLQIIHSNLMDQHWLFYFHLFHLPFLVLLSPSILHLMERRAFPPQFHLVIFYIFRGAVTFFSFRLPSSFVYYNICYILYKAVVYFFYCYCVIDTCCNFCILYPVRVDCL